MNEKATAELRWYETTELVGRTKIVHTKLQQLWLTEQGTEWRDVPTIWGTRKIGEHCVR